MKKRAEWRIVNASGNLRYRWSYVPPSPYIGAFGRDAAARGRHQDRARLGNALRRSGGRLAAPEPWNLHLGVGPAPVSPVVGRQSGLTAGIRAHPALGVRLRSSGQALRPLTPDRNLLSHHCSSRSGSPSLPSPHSRKSAGETEPAFDLYSFQRGRPVCPSENR